MGRLHLGSALLFVPDVVLEKPHHRRSQGTSSFPEELSTGIKPVDPGSVIVGRRKWVPHIEQNALMAGMERHLTSVRAVNMSIPAAQADPATFFDRVREAARDAIERDGAEVVVLAEIAPPGFARLLRDELGAAFVDPGMASWKWAEMMADLYEREAVSHAEIGDYEQSPEQGDCKVS